MSTDYKGFVVVLAEDCCAEYAEDVKRAIMLIKGVLDVQPQESSPDDWFARRQAKHEIYMKVMEVLK